MVGLGKRKDQRVLSMLVARLEQPEISVRVIEAAYLTLAMDTERQGWRGADYALGPRQRFSFGRSFAIFDLTFSQSARDRVCPEGPAQEGNESVPGACSAASYTNRITLHLRP
jgi:hypothetical protein